MVATARELHNETLEALAAWREATGDADKPKAELEQAEKAYHAAFAKWETAKKQEDAAKALEAGKPVPGQDVDFRENADPNAVKPVKPELANRAPEGFKDLGNGVIVPFASKTTEGFIRTYPAAVQRPEIMARYGPELQAEAQRQRDAFAMYMRLGHDAMKRKAPELYTVLNAMQEDDDSEGGYLVPSDQRIELIHDPGSPGGTLRRISRVLQTSRDGGTFPSGTTAAWGKIAEEQDPGETDPVFAQVTFTIRKSGINFKMSEEFLADSATNVVEYLNSLVREESGRYEDQQGIEGDGTTEPLGLRVAGAHGTIGDITDLLTLAAPTLAEILNAFYELGAQFRENATWHMSSSFWARVLAISSSGGQIWTLPSGQERPRPLLLGSPVEMFDGTGWDNAATIAASEEVGAIGDFRHYVFMDRLGTVMTRDDSVYTASDQVLIKARKRYDSFFDLAAAFLILKGATS
jgi:HK97 family phage major capsid protein